MLDKLRDVEAKYERLTAQLSDPNVVADQERFQSLAKQHADREKMAAAAQSASAQVNIDPEKPAMPVGYPSVYPLYLAKRQGSFATLGLAEDTGGLNEQVLKDEHFVRQCLDTDREREAMFSCSTPHRLPGVRRELPPPSDDHDRGRGHEQHPRADEPAEIAEREEERALAAVEVPAGDFA